MFGASYVFLDRGLTEGFRAGPQPPFSKQQQQLLMSQLIYATEMLADILNRCNGVELARVAAESDEDRALDLHLVLKQFDTDIEEARLRARRAGLLREEPVGWMVARGSESDAHLKDETGEGMLVPGSMVPAR